MTPAGSGGVAAPPQDLERQLEQHRRELVAYSYRMLGSAFEAEDAVQETMVRAWRSFDRFEGRSSLRSWLYRIATNVCLDMLDGRNRRARPMEMGPEGTGEGPLGDVLPESVWLQPMPDGRVLAPETDPAELAVQRESIRLAFMAALQHLPPRQRVVLILREVLRWKADEVAALLGSSVASVNSALQRARATMDATGLTPGDVVEPEDEGQRELLGRYLDAFERYDLDSLTSLLTEDATLSMPPYPLWMRGPDNIRQWMLGVGSVCRGSRLVPTTANGLPAFGHYHPSPDGGHRAWAVQVLEVSDGKITAINSFLDTEALFPLFGLPLTLEADSSGGEDDDR
jgi:RNA polymerase sigma-70 factor (ECF subfamily)